MKRHPAKRIPKHIRRALSRLTHMGVLHVLVTAGSRCFRLEWQVGGETLSCNACRSAAGGAFENLWATIRGLFRARGIMVPA